MSSSSIAGIITHFSQSQPDQPAIRFSSGVITYRQLAVSMNRTASILAGDSFNNPIVLIVLERSPEMIISILGALHAGLIFAPVNPSFPAGRIGFLIKETGAQRMITSEKYHTLCTDSMAELGQPVDLIVLDELLNLTKPGDLKQESGEIADRDECYIYFTSGSTGKPKGILGSQKGLLHFINWEIEQFSITSEFQCSQLTPPSFDPYLRDIFVPLLSGGCCCIPSYETMLEPAQLIRWLDEQKIGLMHIVPSLFKALSPVITDDNCLLNLKYIMLAGEMLRGNDVKHFLHIFQDRIQLVNLYGPTETTLAKLFYPLQVNDGERSVLPVGLPIPGARAIVFDHNTQRGCRPGKIGEVIIRTPYRSYGYINDQDLNHQMFVPNPFTGDVSDIIYKTGDLGRMLPDNNIELTGRIGQQVKIRGHRIEPGEIESQLLKLDDIKEAVVLALKDEDGEYFLCAYLLPQEPQSFTLRPSVVQDIKQHLTSQLPAYMVPHFYVLLKHVPLNSNGKIDRRELARMESEKVSADEFVAPTTRIEKQLVDIWAGILSLDRNSIGLESNFFELGGHSLKAIELASSIKKTFKVKLPLSDIFSLQTLGRMAQFIGRSTPIASYAELTAAEKKEYYELSSAQKRLYFMQQVDLDSAAFNIFRTYNLSADTDGDKLAKAFQSLVDRHDSLRTSFITVNHYPVQRIHESIEFHLERFVSQSQDHIDELAKAFNTPFDLTNAPLLKAGLIEIQGQGNLLLVSIHHIVTDALSNGILIMDVDNLYNNHPVPEMDIQYKDYSEWQNRFLKSAEMKVQEQFWLEQLTGTLPVLNIPTDFDRPAKRSFAGASIIFAPSDSLYEQLKKMAVQQQVTLAMVLLTAYITLLFKLTGQHDIIVGSPITGRAHDHLQHVIGMLVNMLPLRSYPLPEKTFDTFLREVKAIAVDCYENQDYPFEKMTAELDMKGISNRNPIFDAVFEFVTFIDNQPKNKNQSDDKNNSSAQSRRQSISTFQAENKLTPFDMIMGIFETKKGLRFNFTYTTSLFKESTANDFTLQYLHILNQIVEDPSRTLHEIDLGSHMIAADNTMFEEELMEFNF